MSHIHKDIAYLQFNDLQQSSKLLISSSSGYSQSDYYYGNNLYSTNFFEILFFKVGNGQIWINDKKIELTDNSIIFLSPAQRHCYHLDIKPTEFRYLTFKEEFLYTFLADKYFTYRLHYYYQTVYPPVLNVNPQSFEHLFNTLYEMESEIKKYSIGSLSIINSLLYYILSQLNRSYAEYYNIPVIHVDNNIAYQFKELIEKDMSGKQTVAEYASKLGISRVTLNTAVKTQFGLTATELLKNKLIHNIKNDLVENNLSVAYLSEKYGFSEPNHLMRFFKSQTGQTIGAYLDEYATMLAEIH